MVALTDADLVSRAQSGQLDAFEELVRRHRLATHRVALRMLGDESDAEDATQDAFVQAWRNLGGFRADAAFSTWMYRIVTNRCLNMIRARRRLEPLPDDREAPASQPDRIAEARWQVEDLKQAILRLTPEQRGPLVLRELEGCSYEEIAEALDLSISAVKSRLHRARLELLSAMGSWR
ncbi:MAG TPA: sigma-70 family RNA polymerase sigma factor [Actinomycetes bacterium]|jgi:RNA polymerase sigma-70 factor (ECF subfamily)|nr:sigma-70 family RNA polymerase sigma factor [Actinomycetes bacterium]HEV3465186.1 sigma-70 family RNA polymerase sigma factor [Actinomycetota bacterium]HEX2156059.1 sigma-70 family RNA polymerase sigma factor [Actinomycetes bacterium]